MQDTILTTGSLFAGTPVLFLESNTGHLEHSNEQAIITRELGYEFEGVVQENQPPLNTEVMHFGGSGPDGWRTYNFEVTGHHTYVADGIRVHNDSTAFSNVPSWYNIRQAYLELRKDLENGNVTMEEAYDNGNSAIQSILEEDRVVNWVDENGGQQSGSVADYLNYVYADTDDGIVYDINNGQIVEHEDSDNDGIADNIDEDFTNSGNLTGDRDGDGIINAFDGDDGVGFIESSIDWVTSWFTPIIIDLDGDGIELSLSPDFSWDADGDGYLETMNGWAHQDDAFLVIDLNADGSRGSGDGVIDQSRELAFSLWGNPYDTDLQALQRAFDDNNDGIINASDSVWSELKIWQDLNQDGVSDTGELKSLNDIGISEIRTNYDDGSSYDDYSDDVIVANNALLGTASYVRDGEVVTGGVGDVALSYAVDGYRVNDTEDNVTYEYESGTQSIIDKISIEENPDTLMESDSTFIGVFGDDRDNQIDGSVTGNSLTLWGEGGSDNILSGAGNDVLFGGTGHDNLYSGAGDDVLHAGAGASWSEYLPISFGNDNHNAPQIMDGMSGSDTYIISADGGAHWIAENSAEDADDIDSVVFKDVNFEDITFSHSGINSYDLNDYSPADDQRLTAMWEDGPDGLAAFSNLGQNIEVFSFADGTVIEDLGGVFDRNSQLIGDDDADLLVKSPESETNVLRGMDDDDVYLFRAGDGSIRIDETQFSVGMTNSKLGSFNDVVTDTDDFQSEFAANTGKGATGGTTTWVSDTYSGDTIEAIDGGRDTIEFGRGLSLHDLVMTDTIPDQGIDDADAQLDADMFLTFSNGAEVEVTNWGGGTAEESAFRIEQLRFENGLSIDTSDIARGHTGTENDEYISGFDRATWITGQGGNDILVGSEGNDVINGGSGDDILKGDLYSELTIPDNWESDIDLSIFKTTNPYSSNGTNDWHSGGKDKFVFGANDGHDTILDFELGKDQLIFDVDGLTRADVTLTQSEEDIILAYGDASSLILKGVTLEELAEAEAEEEDETFAFAI